MTYSVYNLLVSLTGQWSVGPGVVLRELVSYDSYVNCLTAVCYLTGPR